MSLSEGAGQGPLAGTLVRQGTHVLLVKVKGHVLPVKGHSLSRLHQLPVAQGTGATVAAQRHCLNSAKGTGPTVVAAPTWKRPRPAPSGTASPLEPLDALSRVEEGFTSSVATPYWMWPGHRC